MGDKNTIQKTLFYLILGFLFVPMIQEEYKWIAVSDLDGYDPTVVKDSVMSVKNWLSGDYQVAKEKYRDRFFGFRNWGIRLNNQCKYSFYSESGVENIVVGKENYLYGVDYVEAYKGTDFVGETIIDGKLDRFKKLQDTLAKLGKHLFVVITPNKADLLEEYLPTSVQEKAGVNTNYAYYTKGMEARNINCLDINKWFIEYKEKAKHPLFPQTGIHLTHYGSALFADTLIHYVEGLTQQDLPDFSWSKVELKSIAKADDIDAERALNLMFDLPYYPLPYPKVLVTKEGKYRPTSLTIGDSFFWKFIQWYGLRDVFNNGEFWYYNRERHPDQFDVKRLNIGQEIKNKEVIFIINSAFNLWRFGFGFDLDLYKHFFGADILKDTELLELIIQERIVTAKKDKKWMASLRQKAQEMGVEFEQILYDNVSYVVKKNLEK